MSLREGFKPRDEHLPIAGPPTERAVSSKASAPRPPKDNAFGEGEWEYSLVSGYIGAPEVQVTLYPATPSETNALEGVLKVFEENKTKVEVLEAARKADREVHIQKVSDLERRIRELETALRTVQRLHPHDCELKQTIRNAGVAA